LQIRGFATDARFGPDDNVADNAIRGIALGKRNGLFAGSHSGGERAATMYSIRQTAKLNAQDGEAARNPSPKPLG
jgi:hypothetical protein